MHYLLIYDVVDDYVQRRTPFRQEHLGLARAALDRGELVLGGALANPADKAVLLFRGDSPSAAEAFAQADPYVKCACRRFATTCSCTDPGSAIGPRGAAATGSGTALGTGALCVCTFAGVPTSAPRPSHPEQHHATTRTERSIACCATRAHPAKFRRPSSSEGQVAPKAK